MTTDYAAHKRREPSTPLIIISTESYASPTASDQPVVLEEEHPETVAMTHFPTFVSIASTSPIATNFRQLSRHVSRGRPPLSERKPQRTTLSMSSADQHRTDKPFDRKTFLHLAALSAFSALSIPYIAFAEQAEFSTYMGPISLGFSFAYPSNWTVKKKPIKTHLSEVIVTSDKDSATTAGLVVDAVKIDTIEKFGTPEVVGNKVIQVETKKESVNSATVRSATSETKEGLVYYTLDYTVDSSRGVKRYLAKVTVTGGQLYVLTAQAKVDKFDEETTDNFAKMLDSFKVKKQYT